MQPDTPPCALTENRVMVLGELELSGTVRGVKGILSAVSRGLEGGILWYIVPEVNRNEAEIRREAKVIGVSNLSDAVHLIKTIGTDDTLSTADTRGKAGAVETVHARANAGTLNSDDTRGNADTVSIVHTRAEPRPYSATWSDSAGLSDDARYEDIRGQDRLIRALQIAAAGRAPPDCLWSAGLRKNARPSPLSPAPSRPRRRNRRYRHADLQYRRAYQG